MVADMYKKPLKDERRKGKRLRRGGYVNGFINKIRPTKTQSEDSSKGFLSPSPSWDNSGDPHWNQAMPEQQTVIYGPSSPLELSMPEPQTVQYLPQSSTLTLDDPYVVPSIGPGAENEQVVPQSSLP